MNRKQILEALDEIGSARIGKAEHPPKGKARNMYWYSGIAAVLVIAVFLGVFLGPQNPPAQILDPTQPTGQTEEPSAPHFAPVGPKLVCLSGKTLAGTEYPEYALNVNVEDFLPGVYDYLGKTMEQYLPGTENGAFSPMNLYMALAMLAEATGGDTRQEILDFLGAPNVDVLRRRANILWNGTYLTGHRACNSTLANSLWLQEGITYNADTIEHIAASYYASVFGNNFSSADAAKPIAQWIDRETGGLLQEQTGELTFDPNTVLALVSTVYLQADWASGFEEKKNTQGLFNGTNGQTACTYMNRDEIGIYYWGKDYGAVCLGLGGGYDMWLILPDADKTTEDVLRSGEYMELFVGSGNNKRVKVNLSLPKFNVSCKQDMIAGLKKLGVQSVFEPGKADFTPAFPDGTALYVKQVEQATRVSIDENGVAAASYVTVNIPMGIAPGDEVDFILDRPFLFVITSNKDLPVFAGCVNNP